MPNNKPIILWGATGHAIVLEEILSQSGYTLVALFDNNPEVKSPFPGVLIYYGTEGFNEWRKTAATGREYFAAAIGGDRGPDRVAISGDLIRAGLQPCTIIHPSASVATNASLGTGSQVLMNASVCARVKTGNFCIVNTSASVDHECLLGEGVHIGPGAKLAGCVVIGSHTFIGTGAVIIPRIKIGSHSMIGAGSVVTRDIPDNVIAVGNPARIIKNKSKG
jgi:sugar O-acyltransferase (sialic acid O-acetyltransferase NeuD family)